MAKGTKTGGGSRKGIPNKVSGELRGMILAALDKAGGVRYLTDQAQANPSAFLSLVGKVLPKEVTGAGGKDLVPDRIILEFAGQ